MLEKFVEEYEKQLALAVVAHPKMYGYSVEFVPKVVERMKDAFVKGTYNKDGPAMKATCKSLGIKYTYPAINEYLRGEK